MRVAVTGGSGFIGSNTVEMLLHQHIQVLNIDVRPPLDVAHKSVWGQCDLLDCTQLKRLFLKFAPTHVIHLAARTDLKGNSVSEYAVNVAGVKSLMDAVESCKSIERVIYTSSMLVCHLGYKPCGDTDYSPTTAYGESKVAGEELVRARMQGDVVWAFARPCSIWGPRFGEPYRQFFEAVLNGRFVKFGPESVKKTFGYVGNTVYQLMRLLEASKQEVHRKVFYLGDDPPLNAGEWAADIARLAHVSQPLRVPLSVMRLAAKVGDGFGKFGIAVPMTTFRLNNMTTNNTIDLCHIQRVAPSPPYDLQQGIQKTIEWIGLQREMAA